MTFGYDSSTNADYATFIATVSAIFGLFQIVKEQKRHGGYIVGREPNRELVVKRASKWFD